MQISSYYVNELGLLIYSGLPTDACDLKYSHFNGKKYQNQPIIQKRTQYEVCGSGNLELLHCADIVNKLGLRYILFQNCYRIF